MGYVDEFLGLRCAPDVLGTVELFGLLVTNGLAWRLQGSYGRVAEDLIRKGFLDRTGKVLRYPEEGEWV